MKRDARIGLAVVLVLGLAVTLLVGRAIYKRGAEVADADADLNPGEAPASSEVQSGHGVAVLPLDPLPSTSQVSAVNTFTEEHSRSIPTIERHGESVPVPAASNRPNGSRPRPTGAETGEDDHETPVMSSPVVRPRNDAEAAPAPADGYAYTVQKGDSLSKIATKVYGDTKFAQRIADANGGNTTVVAGKVIKIPVIPQKTLHMKLPAYADAMAKKKPAPEKAPVGPAPANMRVKAEGKLPGAAAPKNPATIHKVQPGENLAVIAKKHYGANSQKAVAAIVSANPGLDPNKLRAGKDLVIPAKNW